MSAQCSRCLKVTDTVHTCTPTAEFGALEAELDEWRHGERTYPNYNDDYKDMCRKAVAAEQEVARLTAHIRAVANYHDGLKYSLLDGVRSPAWELHHTERRDFALKVFDV